MEIVLEAELRELRKDARMWTQKGRNFVLSDPILNKNRAQHYHIRQVDMAIIVYNNNNNNNNNNNDNNNKIKKKKPGDR